MKNFIILLILPLIILSCQHYNYRFHDVDKRYIEYFQQDGTKTNKSYIYFTSIFRMETAKIYQNGLIIYDTILNTQDREFEYFAAGLEVDPSNDVDIKINNKKFHLTSYQLKNYKIIFISKNQNNITIDLGSYPSKETFSNNLITDCLINNIDSTSNYYLINFKQINTDDIGLIISPKVDTVINNHYKIQKGEKYKFILSDDFYRKALRLVKLNDEDAIYYDDKLIWEKGSKNKFYTADNLINLYYIK